MISAFGSAAERYARGAGDLDAVITELEYVDQAYVEAVRRRERGEAFYGMLLVDDPRTKMAYGLAAALVAQVKGPDERRLALDQLAGGGLVVNGKPATMRYATRSMREYSLLIS